MIKEYGITVTSNLTDEEKDVFISVDLTAIETVRYSGDNEDHCVIDMKSGTGYVLHAHYEDVLKDWTNARNTTALRMANL